MAFCLKPNRVYATNPTDLGIVIFQPVYGDIQLFGSNITLYKNINGAKKLYIPNFDELIPIWDDLMLKNTVNPMNCLTAWIGFTSDNKDAAIWVNQGINIRITPVEDQYIK